MGKWPQFSKGAKPGNDGMPLEDDKASRILKLRKEGKTYKQISAEVGCCIHTVMAYVRPESRKMKNKGANKRSSTTDGKIRKKIKNFRKQSKVYWGNKGKEVPNPAKIFHLENIYKKFGKDIKCYLTGRPLSWDNTKEIHFDHLKPVARGGSSSIRNLGLLCKEANLAKRDKTVKEHIQYCKEVLINHNYKVKEPSNG